MSPPSRRPNPLCFCISAGVDGDATAECYTWAADGQCGTNPGYMLTSCKYSCWEWYRHRREKYKDAPIDKVMDCHNWANGGECGKNPEFMRNNCPESCKDKGFVY